MNRRQVRARFWVYRKVQSGYAINGTLFEALARPGPCSHTVQVAQSYYHSIISLSEKSRPSIYEELSYLTLWTAMVPVVEDTEGLETRSTVRPEGGDRAEFVE